jgi:hypothetical protein
MVYDLFDVMLNSVCKYFIEEILHQKRVEEIKGIKTNRSGACKTTHIFR